MTWIATLLAVLSGAARSRAALQAENLALQPSNQRQFVGIAHVGGMHHHHERAAA